MSQAITKAQAKHRQKALSGRKPGRLILKLAGTTREAWLLQVLVGWWPYTSIQRCGEFWIIRSYEELEEETGLSRDAVKRALKELEKRGVIRRERHQWQGRRVHVWITFGEVAHSALWGSYELPGFQPEVLEGGQE